MIFVTHDLGVIADVADDVVVMYAGQIVEQSMAADIFVHPRHPYTEALLDSVPQLTRAGRPLHAIPGMVPRPDQFLAGCRFGFPLPLRAGPLPVRAGSAPSPPPIEELAGNGAINDPAPAPSSAVLARCARRDELMLSGARLEVATTPFVSAAAKTSLEPVMTVTDLVKEFPIRSGVLRRTTGAVRAVDGVDLEVMAGTTLGLVGESGSGKSTLARLVLRLIDPTGGNVVIDGKDITTLGGPALRRHREAMQMVFQDPYSSLDPRQSIADIVGEPLAIHTSMSRSQREKRVAELLGQVGGWIRTSCSASPTSSRAANASASPSPGPWPSNPGCWSATSRSAHWTCQPNRRSSTSSASSRTSWDWHTCSSLTISRSFATSAIGSP